MKRWNGLFFIVTASFSAAILSAAILSPFSIAWAEQAAPASLSPKAVEALELVSSDDHYKQALGFLRLEALREPASVPLILPYASHKDPDLRAESVRALAAIQGIEAVPLLLDRIEHDNNSRVRRAAMLGAEPFIELDPKILPVLIAMLTDHDKTVSMAAVDIVSRSLDPSARAAIQFRYKREGRHDVRRVLDLAMKRMAAK